VNYRSTEQIVRSFVAVRRVWARQKACWRCIGCRSGEARRPEIRRFETLDDEAEGVRRASVS